MLHTERKTILSEVCVARITKSNGMKMLPDSSLKLHYMKGKLSHENSNKRSLESLQSNRILKKIRLRSDYRTRT